MTALGRCMEASRDCWGEVGTYSFDIDLPYVTLCQGHVWSLFQGAPPHVRMQVAEEIERTDDDSGR